MDGGLIATALSAKPVATAFASVAAGFFAWGFVSSTNDPLPVSLRAVFNLTYA